MTIIGTIKCDRCGKRENAPNSGGYPQDWGAITVKAWRPPDAIGTYRDRRRWYHTCPKCSLALTEFLTELTEEDVINGNDTRTAAHD